MGTFSSVCAAMRRLLKLWNARRFPLLPLLKAGVGEALDCWEAALATDASPEALTAIDAAAAWLTRVMNLRRVEVSIGSEAGIGVFMRGLLGGQFCRFG